MQIALLGDSIIDNKAYVGDGKSVSEHLTSELSSIHSVCLLARDGSTTKQVAKQIRCLPLNTTHVVLSVGGNDLIQVIDQLNEDVPNVASALLIVSRIRSSFTSSYRSLINELSASGRTLIVLTIYDHIPGLPEHLKAMIRIFNDSIAIEAFRVGAKIIDLSAVCCDFNDYSEISPIEPSSQGGRKIAKEILKTIKRQ